MISCPTWVVGLDEGANEAGHLPSRFGGFFVEAQWREDGDTEVGVADATGGFEGLANRGWSGALGQHQAVLDAAGQGQ
jgi:hypothetical protein